MAVSIILAGCPSCPDSVRTLARIRPASPPLDVIALEALARRADLFLVGSATGPRDWSPVGASADVRIALRMVLEEAGIAVRADVRVVCRARRSGYRDAATAYTLEIAIVNGRAPCRRDLRNGTLGARRVSSAPVMICWTTLADLYQPLVLKPVARIARPAMVRTQPQLRWEEQITVFARASKSRGGRRGKGWRWCWRIRWRRSWRATSSVARF
jgi:hypothetical protein